MERKICTACGREKDIIHFAKLKTVKSGRKNICKTCHKIKYQNKPGDYDSYMEFSARILRDK